MSDNTYPKFVVTVLKDQAPIALVETIKETEDSQSVEVYHQDQAGLSLAHTALLVAADGISYLIWKLTGQYPPPRGFEPADEDEEPPF